MSTLAPTDPRTTLVTAPAGSGKTTLLVQHLLLHLRSTTIDRIVAITFTRKAAAELLSRLAEVLRGVVNPSEMPVQLVRLYGPYAPDAARAKAALAALDAAPVGTVDSFVLSLLQENLLHAHFPLPDGRRVYLDAPLEGGGSAEAAYEAAARELLEGLGAEARLLLGELSLGEAIRDVAAVAQAGVEELLPARALVDALGEGLAEELRGDPAAWMDLSAKAMEQDTAVGLWLASVAAGKKKRPEVPAGLPAYLGVQRNKEVKAARERALQRALDALGLPGVASPTFWLGDGGKVLRAWKDAAKLARADAFRAALWKLSQSARGRAFELMAAGAGRGYDDLLGAATALCQDPPPALAGRYDVLMVDEVQDTNPAQLSFYKSFAAMRAGLKAFYVGDTRQSIYRFRQADPSGWVELIAQAKASGTQASLNTNWRSSRLLVDAQRTAFAHLCELGEAGVDPLDEVVAPTSAPDGLLEQAGWPAPVLVVDDEANPEPAAVAAFARRLLERRASHPGESAAVITRSWARAQYAVEALAAYGVPAQLTGERTLLATQTAKDLRVWLSALLDVTDELALAAVLKHPSIGLTDRGLLLLRHGGGFSRLFAPGPDLSGLCPADRERAQAALPLLLAARRRLGRESTADVLEWLVAALHWRPLIEAGPEGRDAEGVAQLDVLLELVRQAEREAVDPTAAAAALDPERSVEEVPVVRMHRAQDTVTVTSYFAAKGLEFDHVLLLQVAQGGDDGGSSGKAFTLDRTLGTKVLGVKLDPDGGLSPWKDPVAVLGGMLCENDARAEGLRLFYVGFTRAKRSVTFGLKAGDKAGENQTSRLRAAFIDQSRLGEAVQVIAAEALELKRPQTVPRQPMGRVAPFVSRWAPSAAWALRRPSEAEGKGRPRPAAQLLRGTLRAPDPAEVPALRELPEVTLGSLVHGWMQWWGLKAQPTPEMALEFLEQEWSSKDAAAAAWLIGTGLALRDGIPGLAELVTLHRLEFEVPVLDLGPDSILSGRMDLLVHTGPKEVAILDFKGGAKVPSSASSGADDYIAQLQSYQEALEHAGYRVTELGLLYTRQPTWLRMTLPTAEAVAG